MSVQFAAERVSSFGGIRSQLDWKLIKAMLWTETGAASAEWKTKPMQIGVPGDPGLASLLSGAEGGELILPPIWQRRLTAGTVRAIPAHNIRCGIGYLLMRLANFEYKSMLSPDVKTIHQVTIKPGDSLDRVARSHGSTTDILRALNPATTVLRPGQVLKYQKGAVQRVIASWRPITTVIIAQRYNGGGDPTREETRLRAEPDSQWEGHDMQMKIFVLLAAFIAAPRSLMAAEAQEPSALDECGAYSQAGMRECFAKKSRDSAAAAKQAESKAVSALSTWDEDAKYVSLAKDRLKASDAAFERYREAQCAFVASLGGGAIGNALEIRRLACVIDMNQLRAKSVSTAVASLRIK